MLTELALPVAFFNISKERKEPGRPKDNIPNGGVAGTREAPRRDQQGLGVLRLAPMFPGTVGLAG